MRINVLKTFLEGKDRYEQGDSRTVSDEDGARFVANGWATDESGRVAVAVAGESNLNIQNSAIGLGDRNG